MVNRFCGFLIHRDFSLRKDYTFQISHFRFKLQIQIADSDIKNQQTEDQPQNNRIQQITNTPKSPTHKLQSLNSKSNQEATG